MCLCARRCWTQQQVPVRTGEREGHDDPRRFVWPPSFPAFQRHNGDIITTASVKHLSHRRFVVSFQLDGVQRTDQDLYRCVTQSPRGSGVSNFAELVVKGKNSLFICLLMFPFFRSLPALFFLSFLQSVFPLVFYDDRILFSPRPH